MGRYTKQLGNPINIASSAEPSKQLEKEPEHHSTTTILHERNTAINIAPDTSSLPYDIVAVLRKVLMQDNNQPHSSRLTADEKDWLRDVTYEMKKAGLKCDANKILRVALNNLMLDYIDHGEQSVLQRTLTAAQQ